MQTTLDLYRDYLLSSFGQATATGLSHLTGGAVDYDQQGDIAVGSYASGNHPLAA